MFRFCNVVATVVVVTGLFLAWGALPAEASDPEGCLVCHRYRGLGRLDEQGKRVRLFYVDPNYYDRALGPHTRLRCTDCHDRKDVEVVPHRPVKPVNCTGACHLAEPSELEVRFSHDRIAKTLGRSVHSPESLAKSNRLLGQPLRKGQSQCLLCHDEPVFRRNGKTWAELETPIGRCNVCHGPSLPVNARYSYWHVHARSRPARSHEDIVRICAVCHSNPAIQEHFELPDSVASYLASFHGKATQLGSEKTAACLDCHVAELQNVHAMLRHDEPGSPTSAAKLADTCRSPQCHPTAGRRVSTAAVHMSLATDRGIEFAIACLFILLILFTFGPSLVLTSLEMLQVVIAREDPGHHKRLKMAERLLMFPEGRERLKRFTVHHRLQHWVLVACFVSLVLTGFPMKFADRAWAGWLIDLLGGLGVARKVHHWAGILMLLGFIYHFVFVGLLIRRQLKTSGKSIVGIILGLPMVMRWEDWKQMGHLLAYLVFLRRDRPKAGRFSLEEKFEYFGVFWGIMLLGATGLLMWDSDLTSRYLTGRVLTLAALVHTFEAFLALLHVGIVHMVTVIFAPSVFPISPAMFTGTTPAEELAEGHAAMVEEAARELNVDLDEEVGHD